MNMPLLFLREAVAHSHVRVGKKGIEAGSPTPTMTGHFEPGIREAPESLY
jgi:hypothetical protein